MKHSKTARASGFSPGQATWLKALAGLALSIFLVSLIAPSATANPAARAGGDMTGTSQNAAAANGVVTAGPRVSQRLIPDDGVSSPRGVCDSTDDSTGDLPVTRWSDGMTFHDRLHGYKPGDIAKSMQRQGVVSMMFGIGNTAWSVTTGATEMAVNFCVLDKVGGLVDNTAADIGNAIIGSGLVALFVVMSGVVYLWRVGRSQGGGMNTSAIMQKALVLSLFGIMVAGATNSTGGGADRSPGATYSPGVASPGWFVTQIDQVVSTSASALAGSVEAKSITGAEDGPSGRANLGCAPYVKAMKDIYRERYGAGFGADAAATVPLLLSSMWEASALEMWKEAQFGSQDVGTYRGAEYGYGDLMYCRMLDYNVAAKRWPRTTSYDTSVSSLIKKSGALDKEFFGIRVRNSGSDQPISGGRSTAWSVDTSMLAWRYSTSNKYRDRQWVGWAACTSPQVEGEGNDPGAGLVHDGGGEATDSSLRDNCANFFTKADWDGGGGTGEFDWDESDDDISDTATSDDAEDFLLTLHGNRQSGGMVAGLVYMTSSSLIAAVFILFSCAILVAKVAALVMMLAIFLVLTMTLLPNTSMNKITDFLKQYVGLSLFAWGAQLIMSVIALLTSILINVGNQIVPGGAGGVMSVAWVGFAPVIAVFCLHFIFKKMKIPSPLKMSGGMAWGQMAASGAVGGAAGMGAGALVNRAQNRVKNAAGNRSKQAMSGVMGRGAKSKMSPAGAAAAGAAGGAVGAVAGGRSSGASDSTDTGDLHADAVKRRDAKEERKEAEEFAKTAEGAEAIDEARKARGAGLDQHVKDRLSHIGQQFRDKPIRTSLKYGAVTMAGLATGGLAGAAILGAGGAAALIGGSGARKGLDYVTGSADTRDAVDAYRDHQRAQREAQNRPSATSEAEGSTPTSPSAKTSGHTMPTAAPSGPGRAPAPGAAGTGGASASSEAQGGTPGLSPAPASPTRQVVPPSAETARGDRSRPGPTRQVVPPSAETAPGDRSRPGPTRRVDPAQVPEPQREAEAARATQQGSSNPAADAAPPRANR